MKKYLFLLLGLFLAAACTDERDFDQIYPARSSYAFDAAGGSVTIEVTSNTAWSADKDADWLTLTASEDRTQLTATATANTTDAVRTALVTLSGGNAETRQITFSQQNAGFTGRFADLYDLSDKPVFSRNGKFCGGLINEGYLEDGNTAIKAPVIINALTGERRQLEGSTEYYNLRAVSDDGQVIAINIGSAGGTLLIRGEEHITPEVEGHRNARVEAVSSDGSVWVGYAQNTDTRAYAPIKWVNGTPEVLSVPELNMRGTALRNGAMARGCSADGSVVYGSEWDSQGLIYWKNGQLYYPAQESSEIKTILISSMLTGGLMEGEVACYIRMTAEPYCISPNGRYIGSCFYDYKSNGDDAPATQIVYPALVDTETGESHIMKFESVTAFAKGMTADNDGYCYGNSTDSGDALGWVYDYRGPSMTPMNEWVRNHYGVLIDQNRYIINVSEDGNIISGYCVEKSKKAGTVYMGWYYITPEGLVAQQ